MVNIKRKAYFYKGKPPSFLLPLVFLAFAVLGFLALLGLVVGAVLGAFAVFFILPLFLGWSRKRKGKEEEQVEKDQRVIDLKKGEYNITRSKPK